MRPCWDETDTQSSEQSQGGCTLFKDAKPRKGVPHSTWKFSGVLGRGVREQAWEAGCLELVAVIQDKREWLGAGGSWENSQYAWQTRAVEPLSTRPEVCVRKCSFSRMTLRLFKPNQVWMLPPGMKRKRVGKASGAGKMVQR